MKVKIKFISHLVIEPLPPVSEVGYLPLHYSGLPHGCYVYVYYVTTYCIDEQLGSLPGQETRIVNTCTILP